MEKKLSVEEVAYNKAKEWVENENPYSETGEDSIWKNGAMHAILNYKKGMGEAVSDAVEFAEWLQGNRWFDYNQEKKKWHYTFEHGTSMSQKSYEKNYMKTTEELYELFKNRTNE